MSQVETQPKKHAGVAPWLMVGMAWCIGLYACAKSSDTTSGDSTSTSTAGTTTTAGTTAAGASTTAGSTTTAGTTGTTTAVGGTTTTTTGGTTAANGNSQIGDNNFQVGTVIANANLVTGNVITFAGRTIALDANNASHVRFAWPGVAAGAAFEGTSVAVTLQDYNNAYAGGPSGNSWYDVLLDGNAIGSFAATYEMNTFTLAAGLPAARHTVWLRKRTEGNLGSTEFLGMLLPDGGNFLAPPGHLARHIEVIGASIETGYGALDTNCSGFVAAQESQDVAWPQLTADALDAELYNISYSGKGLINNIDPVYDPTNTMPVMYQLSDPMDFGVNWDFGAWAADVVIFDIGGNDWEGLGGAPDPNTFDHAFEQFIQQIAGYYPSAHFYVTMNSTDPPDQRAGLSVDFNNIVAELNQAGMPQVHYFEWAEYGGTVFGCDGHPDEALHQSMADALAPVIQADLGW